MKKILVIPAACGVLWLGGCASDAPQGTADSSAPVIIKSPTKPAATPLSKASTSVAQNIPANAQKISIELPVGYKSGVSTVKAGRPVAITFHLKSDSGCGNNITLPAAKWSKTLKVGESATVVYTPTKAGKINFACDMNMYKGTIIVQ